MVKLSTWTFVLPFFLLLLSSPIPLVGLKTTADQTEPYHDLPGDKFMDEFRFPRSFTDWVKVLNNGIREVWNLSWQAVPELLQTSSSEWSQDLLILYKLFLLSILAQVINLVTVTIQLVARGLEAAGGVIAIVYHILNGIAYVYRNIESLLSWIKRHTCKFCRKACKIVLMISESQGYGTPPPKKQPSEPQSARSHLSANPLLSDTLLYLDLARINPDNPYSPYLARYQHENQDIQSRSQELKNPQVPQAERMSRVEDARADLDVPYRRANEASQQEQDLQTQSLRLPQKPQIDSRIPMLRRVNSVIPTNYVINAEQSAAIISNAAQENRFVNRTTDSLFMNEPQRQIDSRYRSAPDSTTAHYQLPNQNEIISSPEEEEEEAPE